MAFPFRRKKIRIVCSVVVTAGSTLTTTTSLCRAFTFVPTSPTTVATATARCSRHRGKQKTHQNDFRTKTGSCRPRRLLYSIQQPIHPNQGPADEEELASVWQVGDNVYQDLDRLEQAIAFANADQDLQHQNRLETLNYVAQQRRPVPQDWVQKVVGPWLFSFALASILRCGGRRWQRGIATASSLHFWWWIVGAPMLVLSVQLWTRNSCATTRRRRRCGQQQPPTPEPTQEKNAVPTTELQGLDPNYWRFVTDRQEPPQSSCRDYVLCLLEQWISVVVGVAVAGPFLYHFLNCRSRWCWVLFMAGRLGVMAALHQYPKLWFELMRTQQPRPVPWSVWATQCLVSRQYTPWFTAVDLALFASSSSCTSQPLEWSRINIYYGTGLALASLLAMTARYVTPERTKQVPALPFRPPVKLLARAAAIGWIFGRRQYLMKTFLDSAKLLQTLSVEEFIIYFPWQKVANGLGLGIALLGPVCHLLAFRKLVRLSYTHGLSLAMDVDKYKQALTIAQNQSDGNNSSIAVTGPTTDDDKERRDPSQRLMWRYQLRWREPQRILVTLNQWRRKFGYWLFLAGSVEDKLRREYRTKRQSETKARGLSVLQRIAEEKAKNPQAPMLDRTKWKETAMKRIAEKHQQDYELNTCDDPLGIALYQALGIGLGFSFDHMSKMKDSEKPSTRRLQARAAKSAIKRVQEIYDAESVNAELDKIPDPRERNKKAAELRRAAEEEIKLLAQRLSELVPTDLCLDTGESTKIEQYDSSSFHRTSKNEYVMPSAGRERSTTIENLFKKQREDITSSAAAYTVDYLNPMGTSRDDTDDDFLEEWSKRYSAGGNSSLNDDDDDDEGGTIKTILV